MFFAVVLGLLLDLTGDHAHVLWLLFAAGAINVALLITLSRDRLERGVGGMSLRSRL
jgi:hypothetical protein